MPKAITTSWYLWIALDIVLWLCMPTIFLAMYVLRYSYPFEAVVPHLRLILCPFILVATVRIAAVFFIKNESRACMLSGLIAAIFLQSLLAYYALIVIGLNSWNQVISWDLMRSYAAQAPDLADALGFSLWIAGGALMLLLTTLTIAIHRYFRKLNWTIPLHQRTSRWLICTILLAGIAYIALHVAILSTTTVDSQGEPIGLTFFPHQINKNFENHGIDIKSAEHQDLLEDIARSEYSTSGNPDRKNLILIVVDGLRPSNMGIYGYPRDTTPHMDKLKRSGLLSMVSEVRSSCSESACGHYSLATSKYVHHFSMRPFTLYDVLSRYGYERHMIIGGDHTNFYGLKELYKGATSYFDGSSAKGYYMNDDQFVIDRTALLPNWSGTPVMIQYHLMSAHTLSRHRRTVKFTPTANYMLPQNRGNSSKEKILNYYDNGVVQTDLVVQDLLSILEKKGYLSNALVVVTADHGEALGEHGIYAHANGVIEEIIRIPLVFISFSRDSAERIVGRHLAAQVDIAPTILKEFRMTIPQTWSGRPIQSGINRSFSYFMQGYEIGLIDERNPHERWKFWWNKKNGDQFAFNLSQDPHEALNASSSAPKNLKQDWIIELSKLRSIYVTNSE